MIEIDEREPEKIFNIAKKQGMVYKRKTLLVGDFVERGRSLCIERKSVSDYAQSVMSGHLKQQLMNMEENFRHCYLVISGDFKTLVFNPHIKFSVNQILGSLVSFSVRYNVKIIQAANDTQLVKLVQMLVDKTEDGKIPQQEIIRRTQTQGDIYLSVLCCVPGISINKAKAIAKKYDNLGSLIHILSFIDDRFSKEDEFKVKGIGPRIAIEMRKVFCCGQR